MSTRQARVRPRRPEDLPALAAALLAQQPETRYPFRDPLPVPVEQFLHAHDAAAAWTAEVDGRPVGHACRTDGPRSSPAGGAPVEACAQAHGCEPSELAWVSALFVSPEARGLGLGRRLLDAYVSDARSHGLRPCLEVLPVHPAALALYRASGWRVVHRSRPDWLTAAVGDDGPDVHAMVLDGPAEPSS